MKNPKPLREWIQTQYQRGLLRVVLLGAMVTFILCIAIGYLIQSENNTSTAKAFITSIRSWVSSGDLLQLKQVTGQLVDSGNIDFVWVNDPKKNMLLLNDPINIGWQERPPSLIVSHGTVFQISCPQYGLTEDNLGSFCFGKRIMLGWFLALGAIFVAFFLMVFFLVSNQSRKLSSILAKQLIVISQHTKNPSYQIDERIEIQEVKETIQEVLAFSQKEKESSQKIQTLATAEKVSSLAAQLAHDIRSPLAVLEMTSASLLELSEQSRTMIRGAVRRIKDIVNTLGLEERVKANKSTTECADKSIQETDPLQAILLSPLIEQIISEKHLEWSNKKNIKIDFVMSKTTYGLFGFVQASELKRALSNILNNSFEAIDYKNGRISIKTIARKEEIEIIIDDNGIGIPTDVISRIGERGYTHGKAGGSGLGLFHAQNSIKQWNGNLEIVSETGKGTSVKIILRKSNPPNWFVSKLNISNDSTVIIFDDDASIHQVWTERLSTINTSNCNIRIEKMNNIEMFRKFYRENFADLANALFLIDHEIVGTPESGLDLIENLGIQSQSVLVTSRYEEPHVRDGCARLNLRLLPKALCIYTPIEIV